MARPRRSVCFLPSPTGDSSTLAALAYLAGFLEREEHDFPLADWARLLLVLAPEDYAEPPTAEVATMELPGSAGKLAVMLARIAGGFSPFHPGDGMRAWRQQCGELNGDGWGLEVETCGGRIRGVGAVQLQGRREPEPACDEV